MNRPACRAHDHIGDSASGGQLAQPDRGRTHWKARSIFTMQSIAVCPDFFIRTVFVLSAARRASADSHDPHKSVSRNRD